MFLVGWFVGFITGPVALVAVLYLFRNVMPPLLFWPDD
jgi:hypothetical protein